MNISRLTHLLLAATFFLPLAGPAMAQTFTVKVTNPSSQDRRHVPVAIDLKKTLGKKAGHFQSVFVSDGHEELASQLDDLNGDLVADELAFVCNVPAHSTANFNVELSATARQHHYEPRTAAFMKVWDRKYRYPYINSIEYQGRNEPLATYDAIYGHGAQWESELVGFRVYMDHRQSIDIYGKPTPQLVLDKTNFYSTREDIAAGRGCDILFAGASVGAGSFRGYIDGQPTYVDSVEARGQRVIASGPVRAIVEVTDKNWWYNNKTLQMQQRYTIWTGHRDVEVDIHVIGDNVDGEQFCTGVQKIETDNEGFCEAGGLVGSWGLNVPDKAAEDLVEGVGLGVCVTTPYLSSVKEDNLNYLTLLHPRKGHIRYHLAICALMEKEGYKDAKSWFNWLHQWQAELNQPCVVKVKR
ncbi:MAG: DUF4861 domain-containing protein [Bacteroidales bacterium]|nr:DUF4861 domain-containing protein [Bacteroidales bacterium]